MHGLIALLSIFFFSACDDGFLETDIQPQNAITATNFKIRMTDAPIDYEEVNIDLQGVIIYGKSKKVADSLELGTNAGIYNLLDFQNGIDTLIANAMITIDTIKEVRLILGDNNTVKVDGEIFDLTIPGNAKNGLRIKLCIPLTDFDEFILNIDFDAEKSVKKTGNGFKLKPVIKVLNPDVEVLEGEESKDEEEETEEEEGNDDDKEDDKEDEDGNDTQKDTIELSPAIQAYLAANFPDYAVKQVDSLALCDKTVVMEVKIQDKSDKIYLYFDATETLVHQATDLKSKDIPEIVETAIDSNFKGFKATNPLFTLVLADETIQYQLSIKKGNEKKIVIFGTDGTLICEF